VLTLFLHLEKSSKMKKEEMNRERESRETERGERLAKKYRDW
jgi:hypothetical protein